MFALSFIIHHCNLSCTVNLSRCAFNHSPFTIYGYHFIICRMLYPISWYFVILWVSFPIHRLQWTVLLLILEISCFFLYSFIVPDLLRFFNILIKPSPPIDWHILPSTNCCNHTSPWTNTSHQRPAPGPPGRATAGDLSPTPFSAFALATCSRRTGHGGLWIGWMVLSDE